MARALRLTTQADSALRVAPAQLKLELVHAPGALVLDVELRLGGDAKALARNLNGERAFRLERVGKATKLRNELGTGIGALEIAGAAAACRHWSRVRGSGQVTVRHSAYVRRCRGAWLARGWLKRPSMTLEALNAVVVRHDNVNGARAESDDAFARAQREPRIERTAGAGAERRSTTG